MKTLNQTIIERAKPGRYTDKRGFGLSLFVATGGSRQLRWRGTLNGSQIEMGLGSAFEWDLDEAREHCLKLRKMARTGRDPRTSTVTIPTFAQALEDFLTVKALTDRKATEWRRTLTKYAPRVMRLRVDQVTTGDCIRDLTKIWTSQPSMAASINSRISNVMKLAVANGHADADPAGNSLKAAMPKLVVKRKHHKAASYTDLCDIIAKLNASTAPAAAKMLFEYIALTGVRTDEARSARWEEISGSTWTIPGGRMKMREVHKVPLSSRALDILREARKLDNGSGYIFPGTDKSGLVSIGTLKARCSRMKLGTTVHGLRAAFRTWVAEATTTPREVAEAALAHKVGSDVELSYMRSTFYEKRAELMDQWAAFLTGENVLEFKRSA